jgi:hypothetical protein
MIEIGPNLKEVLEGVFYVVLVIGVLWVMCRMM